MIANYWFAGREEASEYIQGPAMEHGRPILGTEDRARLIGSEGFGFTVRTKEDIRLAMDIMEKDTRLQASRTYPVQHPTMHTSFSWHQGYRPSREEMLEADKHFAQAMGMENARRITWSHEEKDHFHIHALWGQVNPDTGYAYDTHQRHERLARAGILWERDRNQITPARQRDHDIAEFAERADYRGLRDAIGRGEAPITRRRVDYSLALGGYFGGQMGAQRAAFLDENNLTRFPANRGYSYSSKPLADEKTEYIRENRPSARNLHKAHSREAKERARGVGRLYEDHSFEKTANPPVSRETPGAKGRNMGITNDFLDWPWKKAGEVIKKKWQERFPSRDFGKEVEEKGWSDPEVKRQWEKRYGPKREESREKQWDKQQERVRDRWGPDRQWREAQGRTKEPSEQYREERRDHPTRSIWDRLRGKEDLPPWEKEEVRQQAQLRQHGLDKAWEKAKENPHQRQQDYPGQPNHPERGEAADDIAKRWKREGVIKSWEKQQQERPIRQPQQEQENPVSKWYRDQMAKPKPDSYQPLPGQPQEVVRGYRDGHPIKADKEELDRRRDIWREAHEKNSSGMRRSRFKTETDRANEQNKMPALPRPREIPMPEIKPRDRTPATNQQEPNPMSSEGKFYNPFSFAKRLGEIAEEKLKERSQEPLHPPKALNHEYVDGKWRMKPEGKQGPSEETIDRMNKGLINKMNQEVPRSSRLPEESRKDGTAGDGRRDDTEAGKPGILPGGSHEHGSPSKQFRDELTESLRRIRPRQQVQEKDHERER